MAKRIKLTRIVDAVTGEVVQETRNVVHISENWTDRGYRWPKARRPSFGSVLYDGLTWTERGYLAALIESVDDYNRLPSLDRLGSALGIGRRRLYQLLGRFQAVGAVARIDGAAYLSPSVAVRGVYLSPSLWRLFGSQLSDAVPGWAANRLNAAPLPSNAQPAQPAQPAQRGQPAPPPG